MAYSVGSFPVFTWSIRDLVLLSKPTVLTLASLLLSKGHAMLQCLLDYLFRLLPRACSVLGNGNLKWDLRFFFPFFMTEFLKLTLLNKLYHTNGQLWIVLMYVEYLTVNYQMLWRSFSAVGMVRCESCDLFR